MKEYITRFPYNPNIKFDINIDEKHDGVTIKSYLKSSLKFSNEFIKRAKYRGSILLNGIDARVNSVLHKNDNLTITIDEQCHAPCLPYNMGIDVVYEDEQVLIINKPAPLPCLCGPHDTANTLQNAIYSYFGEPKNYVFRPLNRLDCGTSGLMLIAKNAYIQSYLQSKLHTDSFIREYMAIVENFNLAESGVIELPIGRISNNMYSVMEDGRPSKTEYTILQKNADHAIVLVRLYTGRTHQIRVHFSHISCPVLGDYVYGNKHTMLCDRFALHSYKMTIKLPYIEHNLVFESKLPDELKIVF